MIKRLFSTKFVLLGMLYIGIFGAFTNSSRAQADLWISDLPTDTGTEPDLGWPMWVSPHIWLTHNAPGNPPQSYPLFGVPNYVHVRVQNRGNAWSSGTEELRIYWAKASTGLSWPAQWVAYTATYAGCAATIYGDEITNNYGNLPIIIPALPPLTGTVDLWVSWPVPNPADYNCFWDQTHFCLLARIEETPTAPYGMTFAEVSNQVTNTSENNNIAWRNVYVSWVPPTVSEMVTSAVLARNVRTTNAELKLEFVAAQAADDIFDHATVQIDLGDDLYDEWQLNGSQGYNVVDNGNGTIEITGSGSWVGGLPFDPEETHEVAVSVIRNGDGYVGVVDLDMIQYDDQDVVPVGGERFTFNMTDDDWDGLVASGVEDNEETFGADIAVYPNPANTEFVISNMEKGASYEIRMLDILGREVYNGSFSRELKIDVTTMTKGVYYLEITNTKNSDRMLKRMIVN